jgi:hypothetical protein
MGYSQGKLRLVSKKNEHHGNMYLFYCPGCKNNHFFYTDNRPGASWNWNNNWERPTVTPSINVSASLGMKENGQCHFFITDGRIAYQMDCWHTLRGQTVDLPDIDSEAKDWDDPDST